MKSNISLYTVAILFIIVGIQSACSSSDANNNDACQGVVCIGAEVCVEGDCILPSFNHNTNNTPHTNADTNATPNNSSTTTNNDIPGSSCDSISCSNHGTCHLNAGTPQCECDEGYISRGADQCIPVPTGICETMPCTDIENSICIIDDTQTDGYQCVCQDNFVLTAQGCVFNECDSESVAQTHVTVYDMTPLNNISNPVQNGFDPLLAGDSVRVVTEFDRASGTTDLYLSIVVTNADILPETIRLNGELITSANLIGTRQVSIPISTLNSGRLAFDANIPENGPAVLGIDAHIVNQAQCEIDGSASGARLQLAGTVDPKFNICIDMSRNRSIQVSTEVPDKNTAVYGDRNGTYQGISDSGSYRILTQMTLCLVRSDDRTVSFAGSADGTRPWTIDDHLFVEVFDNDPEHPAAQRINAFITTSSFGQAPASLDDGTAIPVATYGSLPGDYTGGRSPSGFTYPAGVVQLDEYLPVDQPTWFRMSGLDTGVAGHLSRLFITSAQPDEFVPECRSIRDCALPTGNNGVQYRSGCIDGQCRVQTCTNSAQCGNGLRCVSGFCTDGCDQDSPCPAGQTCERSYCVNLAQGGCGSYNDCQQGEVCFFGQCQPGCFHPINQRADYSSNTHASSMCVANPDACPRCPNTADRCWYNYCRQCEIDAHCGQGHICNDYSCVPQGL